MQRLRKGIIVSPLLLKLFLTEYFNVFMICDHPCLKDAFLMEVVTKNLSFN